MPSYVQGKEVIDSPGYDQPITLDANGRLILSTTHTQGSVVSVTNTPGSAGNPNVLKVDAQSSNWISIASACVQCDADDTSPYLLKVEQAANTSEFMSLGAAGSTYSTIGIGSADQLLMQTTGNDMIQSLPHGSGISKVGDGYAVVMGGSNDNLLVINDCEVDGTFYRELSQQWVGGGDLDYQEYGLCANVNNNNYTGTTHAAGQVGMGRCQVGNNLAWIEYRYDSGGTVYKESGSANTNVNSSVAGRLNIFITGNFVYYQNKLGSAQKISFTIHRWDTI